MLLVKNIRTIFKDKLKNEEFEIDKSGAKLLEIVGLTYIADEEVIFGKLNIKYANKEVKWYNSQSLNVYDMSKIPAIWKQVADKNGYINSNYGWCVFSKENGEQYAHCLRELRREKNTRRAIMIYNRPSMQWEYNKNGMSDFMCTTSAQILIRDNRLHYVLNQRSCDAIFGMKNDIFWARHVHNTLLKDLEVDYPDLRLGNIYHQVGSLHIYENHFNLIGVNND